MKLLVPAVASIALSVASLSALAMTNADYYGEEVSPAAAQRTIVLKPDTHAVNVERGEIVKFVVNGKEFAWDFDGTLPSVDLTQIAPQGAVEQNVTVYIEPSENERASGY
jgi:hypothetical protein